MKRLSFLIMLQFIFNNGYMQSVKSPDGNIEVRVTVEEAKPVYRIYYKKTVFLDKSSLGIAIPYKDFTQNLTLVRSSETEEIEREYLLPAGKKKEVTYRANQKTYTFKTPAGNYMDVIFRVSNDGVAFSYGLAGDGKTIVEKENTAFHLPEEATAFLSPLAKASSGWAETNPSYEDFYHRDIMAGSPSDYGQGWVLPALFRIGDKGWMLLSETGVDGNYAASHIAENTHSGIYRLEFAHDDQYPWGKRAYPEVELPFRSPWRIIIMGSGLEAIVESTLAQDMVRPLYKAKYNYKPGRAAWSWLVLKDGQTNFETQEKFIDMAARLGYEYLLVDALWDQQIGRDKITRLTEYAKTKGVELILWYNSNGDWNKAPQSPLNLMNSQEIRREELEWLKRAGVRGIKVDFFGGDKQFMMKLYEEILRDANDFGIYVNFHGTTLPRGWDVMYPNFATGEAVKGMEFVTFSQEAADQEAAHCTTLAFTRNVVAPMDFTPLILNKKLGETPDKGPERRTTAAFELALPVVFYSAIQHFGLLPENLDEFPSFVEAYLKAVPTTWDETRFIDGYPGKLAILARRSGTHWYVAGINGENVTKQITVRLPFGNGGKAILIEDVAGEQNKVKSREIILNKDQPLSLTLSGNGGFVIYMP